MSIASKGLSAIGKLAAVALLAGAFLFGLAGVVYMSLQGTEVKVPDLTGKDFQESEKELAALGLKIKKRADRPSTEKPNTVIEQLPKSGDTVKTGQLILVVTSKAAAEGDEVPATAKKPADEDDTEKIEEMITDKPKKPKANSNSNTAKKKPDTTRDVNAANPDGNSNSSEPASNKKEPGTGTNSTDKGNKSTTTPGTKPAGTTTKPAGETRPKLVKPNR